MAIRTDRCAYCGDLAKEDDHVIAKSIMLDRSKGITVPSCSSCNTLKSKDDEYLLASLILRGETYSLPELLDKRAAMERAAFRKQFVSPARKLLLTTARRTIQVGGEESVQTTVIADGDRISNAMKWIVRGLYYNHRKLILDETLSFTTYGALASDNKDEFDTWWHYAAEGTFEVGDCLHYRVSDFRDLGSQLWCFVFYGSVFMRVMVNEDSFWEEYEKINTDNSGA